MMINKNTIYLKLVKGPLMQPILGGQRDHSKSLALSIFDSLNTICYWQLKVCRIMSLFFRDTCTCL